MADDRDLRGLTAGRLDLRVTSGGTSGSLLDLLVALQLFKIRNLALIPPLDCRPLVTVSPRDSRPYLCPGEDQLREGAYGKSVEKIPDCRGERSGRRHRVSAGCDSCEGRRGDGGQN